ncbi:MAG: cobyrinate a,c-diamide synthase [Deltaproteobacteria bacterium]|nr:cobyrinate a,c-diamide synthase [Deltaproteobacteria bacterium]MBW2067254.1 cobyrinate a,c-diamide synthase [Deltaproteobacteria bacterium]
MKAFGITALRGGTGKTILSIGLVALLKRRGYAVIPFKKGPDYIDAGWLSAAAGVPCRNLDLFLMRPEDVVDSFFAGAVAGGVAVIEGNRGLYDGVDADGTCSTAELFKLLGVPAVMVLDITKMTRTASAVVKGCVTLDPDVVVKAVILNRVGTLRHERIVREAIERDCGIPVVGAIPRQGKNFFPERHLGLLPAPEHGEVDEAIGFAADIVDRYVDVEQLLEVAASVIDGGGFARESKSIQGYETGQIKLGVMRDEAFQFYYPENLEALKRAGADLCFFPSKDAHLPPNIDGLYIGGGFPETHLEQLASNETLKREIWRAVDSGMPVYAECGGLMFLCRSVSYMERSYPMVGVFPVDLVMSRKPQGHGYVVGKVVGSNPFFSRGSWLKGHEFHYSRVSNFEPSVELSVKLKKGYGIVEHFDGMVYKNCAASYAHIHALSNREWALRFVEAAHFYRDRTKGGKYSMLNPVILKRPEWAVTSGQRR